MKNTLLFLLIAAAVCLFSIAAYTERIYQPTSGFRAPDFTVSALTDTATTTSLASLRGRFVVLSFWASSDPASRMRNMTYDSMTRKIDASLPAGEDPVAFLSVNFDSSRKLVEQIARRDSINPSDISFASGATARRLISDYRLADGYRAYLIDPSGHVVARNPSEATIRRALEAQ